MKINKFIVLGIITIVIMFYVLNNKKTPELNKNEIPVFSTIEYPSKFNYRQSINSCGPFNTAAIVRTLKKEKVDSKEFSQEIKWKIPRYGTHPWGLEKQLKDHNISVNLPDLKSLTDEEKILFLQTQLSQNKPIIILGKLDNYQHYITIFGFNNSKDEFYIYDSAYKKDLNNLTQDDNGNLPGNRNFTSQELLNFWRGGGILGIYRWYAIVANYP